MCSRIAVYSPIYRSSFHGAAYLLKHGKFDIERKRAMKRKENNEKEVMSVVACLSRTHEYVSIYLDETYSGMNNNIVGE